MKPAYWIGLTVAFAAAGTWGARAAWRAHKDIVTLHVRDLPLASVIARLERQTWETIVTDSRLSTKVTLDLANVPLVDVLDRIGEQAGGLTTTIHAVYRSRSALGNLQEALRSGDITGAKAWTNIAPRVSLGDDGLPPAANPNLTSDDEGAGKRAIITEDRDVIVRRDASGAEHIVSGQAAPIIRFRGVSPEDGQALQEEIFHQNAL